MTKKAAEDRLRQSGQVTADSALRRAGAAGAQLKAVRPPDQSRLARMYLQILKEQPGETPSACAMDLTSIKGPLLPKDVHADAVLEAR